MSVIETFSGSDYEIVAWARGHDVLLYEQYGSYQGEWLMFARDPRSGEYIVYKGWYGSCSGCDSYQATFDYSSDGIRRDDPKVQEFAKDYPPFIEIPRATARALAKNGTLGSVFPANVRDDSGSEVDVPRFVADATMHIKLTEGLPIGVDEVWGTPNVELRRRAWEAYGVERFVTDSGMVEVHREGSDALVRVSSRPGEAYLFLKDASTERRYLLRVPPEMERVRQAKAWSFGIAEDDYQPTIET